ncbi:MAG TPA: hypothetical protein VGZ29_09010 [Terriglobia bacterium]|nr:hypothetical protein [Terriglobia bacterium]
MYDQNDERFDESSVLQPESSPAPAPRGPNSALIAVIALLACAVIVSLAYTFSERKQARNLAAKQDQTMNELQQTLDAMSALRAKVDAIAARPAPPQAPAELADTQSAGLQNAPAARTRPTRKTHVRRRPRVVEDPRWAKMQKELTDQQQQLTSTQQDLQNTRQELSDNLQSTRDDLNGSIAKTHDELVALEKKGERDYHEFDLTKSKTFQHVGPVGMELRKTNTKHDFYDVTLLVDDYKLDKKHVNLYEPVLIYPEDSRQPLELVVNHISRSSVHGYVSAPKYPEAAQNTGAGTPAAAEPASGAPLTQNSGSPSTPAPSPANTGSAQPEQK